MNGLLRHLAKHDDGQYGGGKVATPGLTRKSKPLRHYIDPTVESRKSDEQGYDADHVPEPVPPSLSFAGNEASFHDEADFPPIGYTKKPPGKSLQPGKLPPRRVLLLDDDVELCELLVALLHWSGFEVVVAHRGVEALRAAMAEDFDAVVCDVVMPGMRGDMFYIALERVKPALCKVFVFITGYRDDGEINHFLRHTNCPFLYKPLDTSELVVKIRAVIAAAEAAVVAEAAA